jgi:hypothetical protein
MCMTLFVVGKGTVKCTDSMVMTNVLHSPFFPVNLISISVIIPEQNIMTFDISKMIFQEKKICWVLRTGVWSDELWYVGRGDGYRVDNYDR